MTLFKHAVQSACARDINYMYVQQSCASMIEWFLINLITSGKDGCYVAVSVCLSVCVSNCRLDYWKSCEPILVQFCGVIGQTD